MHSTELHKCSKIYKKKLCEIASHKENLQKIVVIQRDSELFATVDPFPDEIVRFAKVLVTKSPGALI